MIHKIKQEENFDRSSGGLGGDPHSPCDAMAVAASPMAAMTQMHIVIGQVLREGLAERLRLL